MALKAALLDAGDVLYHRPRRRIALTAFLEERGLKPLPADDPEALALKRRAHGGEISREEYFDAVLGLCGLRDRAAFPEGRRIQDTAQIDIEFFDGVPETLHRLKDAGARLGVVTNTHDSTASKRKWFRKVGIDTLWDSFATSCELHLCKPRAGHLSGGPGAPRSVSRGYGVRRSRRSGTGRSQIPGDDDRRLQRRQRVRDGGPCDLGVSGPDRRDGSSILKHSP